MLVDTHCHMNLMIKKNFDTLLTDQELANAQSIINTAHAHDVFRIINIGTNIIESMNCISLAQKHQYVYATVGIHPTDCTSEWRTDLKELTKLLCNKKENKIVGIGEVGIDRYHKPFDLERQQDAFRAQIELALYHDLALVIHSRDAAQETLAILHEYKNDLSRGIFHCFSYQEDIAQEVINISFALGIGGTITYPKNEFLRKIVLEVSLDSIVLETDAPFLPPQIIRGKENHPLYIQTIAEYIAQLKTVPYKEIAEKTSANAMRIFNIR